jgi:hypothetical protein
MKRIVFATLLCCASLPASLLAWQPALRGSHDGNWLQMNLSILSSRDRTHSANEQFSSLIAQGYIEGVVDSLQDIAYCPPPGVTYRQDNAIITKFMNVNPEFWNQSADALIVKALNGAFPCHK